MMKIILFAKKSKIILHHTRAVYQESDLQVKWNVKATDLFEAEWQKIRNLDTNKVDQICLVDDLPFTKVTATTNKWIDDLIYYRKITR